MINRFLAFCFVWKNSSIKHRLLAPKLFTQLTVSLVVHETLSLSTKIQPKGFNFGFLNQEHWWKKVSLRNYLLKPVSTVTSESLAFQINDHIFKRHHNNKGPDRCSHAFTCILLIASMHRFSLRLWVYFLNLLTQVTEVQQITY